MLRKLLGMGFFSSVIILSYFSSLRLLAGSQENRRPKRQISLYERSGRNSLSGPLSLTPKKLTENKHKKKKAKKKHLQKRHKQAKHAQLNRPSESKK